MLESLDTIPWDTYPQPEGNAPNEIPAAIRDLASARTDTKGGQAYYRLLYAVGNDHAGCYYPVVLRVIPFLREILEHSSSAAQKHTLAALADLLTFGPFAGFERVSVGPDMMDVRELVNAEIVMLSDTVKRLERSTVPSVAEYARDFLVLAR